MYSEYSATGLRPATARASSFQKRAPKATSRKPGWDGRFGAATDPEAARLSPKEMAQRKAAAVSKHNILQSHAAQAPTRRRKLKKRRPASAAARASSPPCEAGAAPAPAEDALPSFDALDSALCRLGAAAETSAAADRTVGGEAAAPHEERDQHEQHEQRGGRGADSALAARLLQSEQYFESRVVELEQQMEQQLGRAQEERAALRTELAQVTRTNSSLVALVAALQTQVSELRSAEPSTSWSKPPPPPQQQATADQLGAQLQAMLSRGLPAPKQGKQQQQHQQQQQQQQQQPLGENQNQNQNQNRGTASDWMRVGRS
jgi:hypothetical protein